MLFPLSVQNRNHIASQNNLLMIFTTATDDAKCVGFLWNTLSTKRDIEKNISRVTRQFHALVPSRC